MESESTHDRPEPRSTAEIFSDLNTLAQSDGSLHEISAIIYRDWVVSVDIIEGRVADDPEHRWSTSKLNNNELMLMLGLMVQSKNNRTYSVQLNDNTFAARADKLLREFHDRVIKDCVSVPNWEARSFMENPEFIGLLAREAIYYGADSFYMHQFYGFSRQRYRDDTIWLLQNVGLSIRPMLDIARFIVNRINKRMTVVGHMREEGREFSHGDLTNSLLVSKSEILKKFGGKANAFFAKFTTPIVQANMSFDNPFAINEMTIAPIIDLGEILLIPNQYRLLQSIYESPFYWMLSDESYRDTAAENRGKFLEKTTAHILISVFGKENVYENVAIRENSKKIASEVDVLVVYGEFVLVVQAKSKKVTLKARTGDIEALKADFEGAIQAPYRQAFRCVELISNGADCITSSGKVLTFPTLPRLFPVVVLSDPFPSSTLLSNMMLEHGNNIAPVIWDIGILDCVTRLLPTPIEMIFYLKCRSEVFDKVESDSEYNFLGYHLRAKLAVTDKVDGLMLARDFAAVVDDYMVAADVGLETERPAGILERLEIPVVSELLVELKNAEPKVASVVFDLYDFSREALEDISINIIKLREEISATGKAIKTFSIPTTTGGLTYAVTKKLDLIAARAAEVIGAKHKYDTKSDRWYVILDSIETKIPIDGLLPLVWPWQEDDSEAKNSAVVAKLFNSRRESRTAGINSTFT